MLTTALVLLAAPATTSRRQPNTHAIVSRVASTNIRLNKLARYYGVSCTNGSSCTSRSSKCSNAGSELNPYEVLSISPIYGFDKIKDSHSKKLKEAKAKDDNEAIILLEKAYDKLMMLHLKDRVKGVAYGSVKVPKDIRYADKQPYLSFLPRYAKSSEKDMCINLFISGACTGWILINPNAGYKPLQFMAFLFVYRMFLKLKSFERPVAAQYSEDGEDYGRAQRVMIRVLNSAKWVYGSIFCVSLVHTCVMKLLEFSPLSIPPFLYNQELLVTASSAIALYFLASHLR